MERKIKYHGHSWALLFVGVLMPIVASVIILEVPKIIAERSLEHFEMTTQVAAEMISGTVQDLKSDSSSAWLQSSIDFASRNQTLTYLVISDPQGNALDGINLAGAIRLEYLAIEDREASIEDGGLVRATRSFAFSDSTMGRIDLAMTDPMFMENMRESRNLFLLMGFVLALLSAVIFYSVHHINHAESRVSRLKKLQHDLSQQKGTLESKVSEQLKTEAELKESEQRYRYLLENAMESAFSDLEALNKSLEGQKKELEIEVEERTKAQLALGKYADKLTALNEIERHLVSEHSLEKIVQSALLQIQKLIKCSTAQILEINTHTEEVRLLGSVGQTYGSIEKSGDFVFSQIRQQDKSWIYVQDLRDLSNKTEAEESMVAAGLVSYGRVMLTIGETVVGALIISDKKPSAFMTEEITAVRDIADLISIALSQQKHREEQARYEQELITERDRAEEMAHLKTAFLANMSHEIRTPLSGIIGFSQVLHEEVAEDLKEFTGLIQDAANRLLNTINSVLDLSKLEANKENFQFEKIDVSSAVLESMSILGSLASKKGIELTVESAPGISSYLDKNALQGIVNNLVGNAIKFTEKGGVTVKVFTKEEQVYLTVQDSGVGISKEFLPYLFDEFRQEYMGVDRPHEGSGLGLAIANKLILRMNGQIEVESEPGKGTTFSVNFPVSESRITRKKKVVKLAPSATA